MAGWTQAHIDKLREAIASGAKSVQFGTRRVDYNSIAEMRALLADMEKSVNGGTTVRLMNSQKGL